MPEAKIKPTELSIKEEEKKLMKVFFDDYKKLAEKHGFDIAAKLDISDNGIIPRAIIVKLNKQEK